MRTDEELIDIFGDAITRNEENTANNSRSHLNSLFNIFVESENNEKIIKEKIKTLTESEGVSLAETLRQNPEVLKVVREHLDPQFTFTHKLYSNQKVIVDIVPNEEQKRKEKRMQDTYKNVVTRLHDLGYNFEAKGNGMIAEKHDVIRESFTEGIKGAMKVDDNDKFRLLLDGNNHLVLSREGKDNNYFHMSARAQMEIDGKTENIVVRWHTSTGKYPECYRFQRTINNTPYELINPEEPNKTDLLEYNKIYPDLVVKDDKGRYWVRVKYSGGKLTEIDIDTKRENFNMNDRDDSQRFKRNQRNNEKFEELRHLVGAPSIFSEVK